MITETERSAEGTSGRLVRFRLREVQVLDKPESLFRVVRIASSRVRLDLSVSQSYSQIGRSGDREIGRSG